MQSLKIEMRNVYGETKAYPVCSAARIFAEIAGTKTLTRATLRGMLSLGYTIEVIGNGSRTYGPGISATAIATAYGMAV